MVVAIDGPSGVGKSTVTRLVAAELGLPFLDTGATYRAATLAVVRAGVDPEDASAVLRAMAGVEIGYADGVATLNSAPVAAEIRSPEVTAAVSAVSAHPKVRTRIVGLQRDWVARRGGRAVVEGRDIGTTVFPQAPVKVFLTAAPEVRAARRAGDAEASGVGLDELASELARRDRYDSTREVSPLRPAEDATILDTSELDIDGVVEAVLAMVDAAEREARAGDA